MTDHSTSPSTAIPAAAASRLLTEADDLLHLHCPGTQISGTGEEYRADIITAPAADPAAVVWFRAASITAAMSQARAHLAAQPGPDDRYAELWLRTGDLADFLADVHLGA